MSTPTTATFNEVCERAAEIVAANRPFVDPRDVLRLKRLVAARPAWCWELLGRVPARHPRFGHPMFSGSEFGLLLAASELGYEPGAPDPDVPVADR